MDRPIIISTDLILTCHWSSQVLRIFVDSGQNCLNLVFNLQPTNLKYRCVFMIISVTNTSLWNNWLDKCTSTCDMGYTLKFPLTCLSVHRGVCLSACWDTTPPDQAPPLEQAPPDQAPPWSRHPRDQATPLGTRHPLGPDTPGTRHPPGPGTPQQTATIADGTHPTGMHSCYIIVKRILCRILNCVKSVTLFATKIHWCCLENC